MRNNHTGKPVADAVPPSEVERLRLEYETVAEQVKRLVKAESKLYKYQEKLDARLKEYKALYQLSRKFGTTFEIRKIFEYTIDYVIHHLEYEKVVILLEDENSGSYAVSAFDGYYAEEERLKIEKLTLDRDDPVLGLLRAGVEYLISCPECRGEDLDAYRPRLLMDEFLMYPLGPSGRPLAILVIGNSSDNVVFFRRVTGRDGTLLGAGNLAGLLASTIENHIYYTNMEKALDQKRLAEKALQQLNEELEARVKERTADLSRANEQLRQRHLEASVLYRISSVISQSMDMDKLLQGVLATISNLEVFNVDKGGIFVIEGRKMRMVANLGHSAQFLDLHKDMHVGDCLCGMVAQTGEILISTNSAEDERHTIRDMDSLPHGHLVVPLKTKDRVEGVLDLYLPAHAQVDKDKVQLLQSIGYQLGIAIENVRLYEKTKELASRDSLTGLWNHEEILRILGNELVKVGREGGSVGVIMADLDFFKKINDTYGHLAGDAVISSAAKRLLSLVRPYDGVGRYGGEEFLIVLPGANPVCAADIAERMCAGMRQEDVDTPAGPIAVTMSLGVAVSGQGGGKDDVNSLVKAADDALYTAKENGRNQVRFENI